MGAHLCFFLAVFQAGVGPQAHIMTSINRSLTTQAAAKSQGLPFLGWVSADIRTKILIPLILLMALSVLGSTVGFIVSTNTTRNRVIDGQLSEDAQRIVTSLQRVEHEVLNGAAKLSNDPELIQALQQDEVMKMDSRGTAVRNRYRLDQVLITNAEGQVRVNLTTYSELSQIQFHDNPTMRGCQNQSQLHLINVESTRLLIGCAPVKLSSTELASQPTSPPLLGTVYTVQDLPHSLQRTRRELGLVANIQLLQELKPDVAKMVRDHPATESLSINNYRFQPISIELGGIVQDFVLVHPEKEINETVGAGFRVMIISNGATLILLLILGIWLSQNFTRPILQVAEVGRSLAAGDLSQRSHLTQSDEIGELGRVIDQAADTISELLEERARAAGELRAILNSMADGLLAIDTDERVVMLNPAAAELLGQDESYLLSKPLAILSDVEDELLSVGLQRIIEQLREELTDPHKDRTEERISLGERVVRLHSAPTVGNRNQITGAVVVVQDITQAVEADRTKSAFIATASHELRTPLSGLKGFVDIFQMSGTDNLSESQRMFLDTIKRQTDAMVQMVNDLLEMARLEQKTLRAERRWVGIDNTVQEAVTSLSSSIGQKRAHVQTNIAIGLPHVWIDALHLRRIVSNILSNAVKYIYEGGTIRIRAYELYDPAFLPSSPGDQPWKYREERSVVIEIEDNGVGIKESDQPRVFERFFRSDNDLSIEAGGTGLGLAITQSLVHLHGGQIGFWSQPHKTTCFWVRLPAPMVEPFETPKERTERTEHVTHTTQTAQIEGDKHHA
jgi:PAS domain S-box-containing protein